MGTYCRIHGPPKTQGGLLTASASRVPHSAHPLEAWNGTCAGYVCACASARLTPEIAVAASSSLFLLSPRDSGPPWAQSLSGEGRQQPRMWGRPSPLPLLCLSLAALSSQLGSGARGEEGNLCEGQHGPWTTCWPLPKGFSPPCAPRSDTEAREPQVASGAPGGLGQVRSLQTPLPHLQEDRTGRFRAAAGAPPPSLTASLEAARTTPVHVGWCLTSRAWTAVWATAIFRSLNLLLEGLGSGVQDFLKTFFHLFI